MKPLLTILNEFRNKAWCSYTERKADKALAQLKELISNQDHHYLNIAYIHFKMWEWAGELYDMCKQIEEKYSN